MTPIIDVQKVVASSALQGVYQSAGEVIIASADQLPAHLLSQYAQILEDQYQTGQPMGAFHHLHLNTLFFMVKMQGQMAGCMMMYNDAKTHPHNKSKIPCLSISTLIVNPRYRRLGIATLLVKTAMSSIEWVAETLGYNIEPIRVVFGTELSALPFWKPTVMSLINDGWTTGTETIYTFNECNHNTRDKDVTVVDCVEQPFVLPDGSHFPSLLMDVIVFAEPEDGFEFAPDVNWSWHEVDTWVRFAQNLSQLPVLDKEIYYQDQALRVELVWEPRWDLELID